MLRRAIRLTAALLVVLPMTLAAPAHGHAIGPFFGACTVSGTMSVAPSLTAIPQANVFTNITVSGSCATLQLLSPGSFDVSGSPLASCEVGEGAMTGGVYSAFGLGEVPVTAAYVGGPFTVHLVFTRLGGVASTFIGTADLVWVDASSAGSAVSSVAADANCPLGGSGSTIPVTGVLAFDG